MTRVEALVAGAIILILAFVALGPITRGMKEPAVSSCVQIAHQLGAIEFAYANDHGNVYPHGPDGHTLANLLLKDGYVNDPTIFYMAGTPGGAKYMGSINPYNLSAANCNWDFWVAGPSGLTSGANDLTPLCQLTAGTAISGLPTVAGQGITLTIDTTKTEYGPDGISVCYKGNYALFISCHQTGPTTAINEPTSGVPYVGPNYADPAGASFHSVLP